MLKIKQTRAVSNQERPDSGLKDQVFFKDKWYSSCRGWGLAMERTPGRRPALRGESRTSAEPPHAPQGLGSRAPRGSPGELVAGQPAPGDLQGCVCREPEEERGRTLAQSSRALRVPGSQIRSSGRQGRGPRGPPQLPHPTSPPPPPPTWLRRALHPGGHVVGPRAALAVPPRPAPSPVPGVLVHRHSGRRAGGFGLRGGGGERVSARGGSECRESPLPGAPATQTESAGRTQPSAERPASQARGSPRLPAAPLARPRSSSARSLAPDPGGARAPGDVTAAPRSSQPRRRCSHRPRELRP